MEARIEEDNDLPFIKVTHEDINKKDIIELKSSMDSLIILLKHESSDIRKELTYLATKQESAEIKYELKESIKGLEMKLYSFIVKAVVTTIGIITAIQPIFSMLTKIN